MSVKNGKCFDTDVGKLLLLKQYLCSMLHLNRIHHIAIICSDYERSKTFYTEVLGFTLIREVFRKERNSWKLDLALDDSYCIELFSFPDPPARVSRPEACGLRHLAFEVNDIEKAIAALTEKGVKTEPVRIDEFTGKKFTFFADPDQLPIELYEK
jgi:glyoxylase I family protein